MFTSGFDKTAGLGKIVGAVSGTATKAKKEITKGVKTYVGGQRAAAAEAYRKATGAGTSKAVGEARAMREANKAGRAAPTKDMTNKSRESALGRKAKMDTHQEGKKKSFASKHPFLTAGGLYLGARAALGGGVDNNPQEAPRQPYAQQPTY